MKDYILTNDDKIYNIWNADHHTRLYRSEILRYLQIIRLADSLPEKPESMLDIGCGTGKFAVEMAKRNNSIKVTATDLSSERLKLFEDQAIELSIKQINQNFFNLKSEPADLLVSQEVLEHLPDVNNALRQMRKFVKPGGHAIFCVPYRENLEAKMITDPATGERYHKNGHLHSFTRTSLIEYAEQAGYDVIKIKLNTNKRLIRWLTQLNIPVTPRLLILDDLMNSLFAFKSTYIAVLCRNNS